MVATTRRVSSRRRIPELPPELVAEIARAVARGGEGVTLATLKSVCRPWRSALGDIENEVWRQAALVRFPRLEQIIALSPGEVSSFRSLFAAQHRVEASDIPEAEPEIAKLSEFIITVQATLDGTTVGMWTGVVADPDDLMQGHTIRLWTDPPEWFHESTVWIGRGVEIFVFVTRNMRTARFTPFGPLVVDLNLDDDTNIEERYLAYGAGGNAPRMLGTLESPDSVWVSLTGDGFVTLEFMAGTYGEQVAESEALAAYFDQFVLVHGHGP